MQTETSQRPSYAFVRTPRWIFLHVMVVLAVLLFGVAGFWQLYRLDERREKNAEIHAGLRSEPTDINADDVPPDFHRIHAEGRYDVSNEVIVRNRTLTGRAGSNVLTPLRLDDGTAIIVNRGWIPQGLVEVPIREATPPRGKVTVEGILFPTEPKRPLSPDEPATGKLEGMNRVNMPRYSKQLPYEVAGSWVSLQDQEPAQRGDLPERVPPPSDLGEGSHLVYAVQWFLFIPTAIAVYVALLRREARRTMKKKATAAD